MTDADVRLIGYLARHNHWSPFAHPQVTIHCAAPIFVARQAQKHQVGFVWNEISRRYVDFEPTFFKPETWRGRPETAKQGSAGVVHLVAVGKGESATPDLLLEDLHRTALETYQAMIDGGVAPEMARMCLPQSMVTEWFWTGSLAGWARFCRQRLDVHAQIETAMLAGQCDDILAQLFPVSWAALATADQAEAAAA